MEKRAFKVRRSKSTISSSSSSEINSSSWEVSSPRSKKVICSIECLTYAVVYAVKPTVSNFMH